MTQHYPYNFFNTASNDVFTSVQQAYLISSTTPCHDRPKGLGIYMYPNNIRHCIALFCVRSIPKHSWINSNNVYIGRAGEPK